MKKLKLELNDLEVTSFVTHAGERERGTVMGQKLPPPTELGATCAYYTCNQWEGTCDHETCVQGCYESNPCYSAFYTNCAQCLA